MRPHRKGGWSGRCLWCLIRVAAPRSRGPTARWPGRAGQSAALSSATLRKPEREDNTRSTFKILVIFLGKQRTNQEQVHFFNLVVEHIPTKHTDMSRHQRPGRHCRGMIISAQIPAFSCCPGCRPGKCCPRASLLLHRGDPAQHRRGDGRDEGCDPRSRFYILNQAIYAIGMQ